jgi:hypothetical protein
MDEKQWRTGALADVVVAETVDLGVFVGEAVVVWGHAGSFPPTADRLWRVV